jgi:hypothetical protein
MSLTTLEQIAKQIDSSDLQNEVRLLKLCKRCIDFKGDIRFKNEVHLRRVRNTTNPASELGAFKSLMQPAHWIQVVCKYDLVEVCSMITLISRGVFRISKEEERLLILNAIQEISD